MADIGSLIVKIGADASGLQKAFDDLGGSGKQFQRGMESVSKVISTAFFAATSAAVAMTIAAGKTAEETEQLAQKTGIAASVLEGMTVIMNRNGLSGQSMVTMMKALSKEMVGVASGTASSIKLFSDLGISLDVVGKGTGATLRAIADRFKEMPDGAKKATLAVELFGRAGLEWIPILNKGSVAMDDAMKKSAEFGLILTDTARHDLTVFDDAMDDLMSAVKGFGMQVGIAFAPSMTILVKAFTDVIVFAKNVFNMFADAAEKLSIRLGAMVAVVQIVGAQLFSLSVLSKEAWQETLAHVKSIDIWAASELEGVDAARAASKELDQLAMKHLQTSEAVAAHASSQKTLGEQIVATTKIQLAQIEEMGKHQERMGHDIVSAAKVTLQVEVDEGKVQEALGHTIHSNFTASQAVAQEWVDSYMVQEDAAMARFQAEMDALDRNEEAQGRFIVTQAVAAQQVKGFWEKQLDAVVASNAFSVGQIVSTWTSGIANAIVNGGDFVKAAWQSTQIAIIQGGLNLAVQWAAQQALMATASTAAAATTTAVWAGAAAALGGLFATVTSAFSAMFASLVGIMTAVGTLVMNVLGAIAEALSATVFGIPFAGAILLGIGLIAAALAATGNLGFKEGGIGDFGSGTATTLHGHEAIIPLNSRGADFLQKALGTGGNGSGTLIVKVMMPNGRELARAVVEDMPGAWREAGLPG